MTSPCPVCMHADFDSGRLHGSKSERVTLNICATRLSRFLRSSFHFHSFLLCSLATRSKLVTHCKIFKAMHSFCVFFSFSRSSRLQRSTSECSAVRTFILLLSPHYSLLSPLFTAVYAITFSFLFLLYFLSGFGRVFCAFLFCKPFVRLIRAGMHAGATCAVRFFAAVCSTPLGFVSRLSWCKKKGISTAVEEKIGTGFFFPFRRRARV